MADGYGKQDDADLDTWTSSSFPSEEYDGQDYADIATDGFSDLVPASLEELTSNDDMHMTHLVEGDFFPENSPEGMVSRSDYLNDNDAACETAPTVESRGKEPPKKPQSPSPPTQGLLRDTGRLLPAGRVAKRVRWADEGDDASPLVSHAMTFVMPHTLQQHAPPQHLRQQQAREPEKVLEAVPSSSVFCKKVNGDGTPYFSSKAQRPAQRFILWKRGMTVGKTAAEQVPYDLQPSDADPATSRSVTLFAALCPPYNAAHVGSTVLMRSATLSQDAMVKNALCNGGLQMPLVRPSQVGNAPLHIPCKTVGQ